MTYIPPMIFEKAFAKVEAKSQETAFLTPKPQPKMDYNDPAVCPYCRKQMVRSTILSVAGAIEPVYVCFDDRAVGVVPDSELTQGV